jgi:hypothetical protein
MMTQDEVTAARKIETRALPIYREGMHGTRPKVRARVAETTHGPYAGIATLAREKARGRVPPSVQHLRSRAR